MITVKDFKGSKKYPTRRAQVLQEDNNISVILTEFWGKESGYKGWYTKWRDMGDSLNQHYALNCAENYVNGKEEFK